MRVPLLLADEDDMVGYFATLQVELTPGSGQVVCDSLVDGETNKAAQIVMAAVLGLELSHWNLRWCIEVQAKRQTPEMPTTSPPSLRYMVSGDSLGLPMAVAIRAAHKHLQIPTGVGFTGRVDGAGRVTPVGGMRYKMEAAQEEGLTIVFVGPGGEVLPGTEVVEDLSVLWRRLWPPAPRRRPFPKSPLLLVPTLLSILGVTDPLDRPLSQLLLGTVQGPLPSRRTVIIALPELECQDGICTSFRHRRARVTALLKSLQARHPQSVSFDLTWIDTDPEDRMIAEALRNLHTSNIPVILPFRWGPEGPRLPGSPELRAVFEEKVVRAAEAIGEGEDAQRLAPGRIKAREWDGQRYIWHAAVETVASWTPGDVGPRINGDTLEVGTTAAHCERGRVTLRPVESSECLLWVEPGWEAEPVEGCRPVISLEGEQLAGKSVWVGVREKDHDRFSFFGRRVAGVEVQAAATEMLAAGAVPKPVPVSLVLASTFLIALGRRVGRPGPLPDLLAVGLMIGGMVLLAKGGWLVPAASLSLAVAAGLWLGRRISAPA